MSRFALCGKISIVATLLCGTISGYAPTGEAADLNQIQQQIKQQESKLAEQKRAQAKLQSTLKNQESKINSVAGELRDTELSLQEIRKQIAEADGQIKQLEKKEREQKAKLARQMDAIYRSGLNPSVLQRMFSEDAQKAARMKVYYEHLNRVRIETIENINATQAQIAKQKEEILSRQQSHKAQLSTQKKQQQELEKAQRERQSTLNEINKNIDKDQNKLATLRANEAALRQEIQRAEQTVRAQEQQERRLINSTNGLGAAARQYQKPVSGSTLYSFGSTQAGEARWKGMVIAAPRGTPVRAIAGGRVILAGQLNGYGYMVIVKHGDSDLSLYGFNQAVFVQAGQLVSAGQTIAQVGDSGEVSRPALYFGISRKGVPVNPAGWIK